MSTFLWALFDRLVDFLANLNPERAKKAQAFRDEAKRLNVLAKQAEEDQRQSEIQYAAAVRRRQEIDARIVQNGELIAAAEGRLLESQKRIEQINAELEKANQAVRDRSDDDAFRGGAPRPKNP